MALTYVISKYILLKLELSMNKRTITLKYEVYVENDLPFAYIFRLPSDKTIRHSFY
jgi:hypothetical protein